MPTTFPTTDDALTNPAGTDTQNSPSHAAQHQNANDAIEAIEAKVGTNGDTDATSLDNKVATNTAAIAANLGKPLGLTGATAATRYAGGRASVPPTTGTFAVGDFVIGQNGKLWVCTVAGTPGTWTEVGGTTAGTFSLTTPDYVIYKSGANFVARNTATNVDDFSGTNAGAVVQSAHDALVGGGLIELKSGITFTASSMVNLTTAGVCIRSRPGVSSSSAGTFWQLTGTALAAGQAAFQVNAFGAAVGGLIVDANGKADYAIHLTSDQTMAFDSTCLGANVACFGVGPGAGRCTFWNIRCDNGAAFGCNGIDINGPDHIAWGLRTAGCADGGYALAVHGARLQCAAGHITGQNGIAGTVLIDGDENRLSDFYFDSGPDGTNAPVVGGIHTTIKGSGNWVSAFVQNAATQTAENVDQVVLQAGTTYRFRTTNAHDYVVGQAVWLQGFASSNGAFQTTTELNALVTAVSDTTHFDVDLGSATTFTDQVGTAKKICKYGVAFQRASTTSYVLNNEVHIMFQGKGASANDGEFYYAVGFLSSTGTDPADFGRFGGNRIYANGANVTRFSNLEASWGTLAHSDKIFVDAWHGQSDTAAPLRWRTKAWGVTGSVSATTVTVNHGLVGTPSQVFVTPRGDPAGRVWVSNITATSFVINSSTAPAAITYGWKAEL